VGKYYQQTII